MVASTINAMVLWDLEIKEGQSVYEDDDNEERAEHGFIFL